MLDTLIAGSLLLAMKRSITRRSQIDEIPVMPSSDIYIYIYIYIYSLENVNYGDDYTFSYPCTGQLY